MTVRWRRVDSLRMAVLYEKVLFVPKPSKEVRPVHAVKKVGRCRALVKWTSVPRQACGGRDQPWELRGQGRSKLSVSSRNVYFDLVRFSELGKPYSSAG